MKKTLLISSALLATAALNAAEVTKLVVRQNWPWSPDVRVDYTLTAVTEATDVAVKCYQGTEEIAVPVQAITGPRYGLTAGGDYTLVINDSSFSAEPC